MSGGEGRAMSDFERVCDFQSLYEAHLKARRGKRHKPEVVLFEMDLGENLARISHQLESRTYRMGGYYHFVINEPKERAIYAARYRDRVVLHSVCDQVLVPLLERRLIYDNAACQEGKGTHFALDRLSKFLREHYREHGARGYALKCDVSKYFASIDHEVLKGQLARLVRDADVRRLLYHYIDSYETEGRLGRGLPLGNQSSQCFAVYYLDSLDRLVKERLRVRGYVRYMDDWVLLHHDRSRLQECLERIRETVEGRLRLRLNSKTQIIPLGKGVDFLGWRFFLTDTGRVVRRMRTASKVRMRRRLARLRDDYASGLADAEGVRSCLASYRGHLKHGDAYLLQREALGRLAFSAPADAQRRCRERRALEGRG